MNNSYIIAFWSPFPITAPDYCIDFISSFLKQYGDIQCLDCKNSLDIRTLRMVKQADLVVIGLRQNYREICDYFCWAAFRFHNYIYMVVDYFPEREICLERISHEFRVPPSRLTCVPFNTVYHDAVRTGYTRKYWHSPKADGISQACADFKKELVRSALLMLKALEE